LQWSETTFKAGIKNGKTTTWYENGKKRYDGFYKNDLESGKWTYWNEAGELVNTQDFDHPASADKK
jgi:antitoxin component YwqK of YwqJK toxin-antitoxin module